MFKSILIATDGSELSEKAVSETLALARSTGARATAVTVVAPYSVMDGYRHQVADISAAMELHKVRNHDHAEQVLGKVRSAALAQGVDCNLVQVEHTHPWQGIIETAAARGCDLIAMASHGRSGMQALLVGSETQKVLTHSKVPVLVYR